MRHKLVFCKRNKFLDVNYILTSLKKPSIKIYGLRSLLLTDEININFVSNKCDVIISNFTIYAFTK